MISYPLRPGSMLDPPAQLAALREHGRVVPIRYAGGPAWLLTRYPDIRAALSEPRLVFHLPGFPTDTSPDTQPDTEPDAAGVLFLMNGPKHMRLRRAVAGTLSARRIAALRPSVERLARSRLTTLTAGGAPADMVRDYAVPLAIDTLSELLGIAIADRPDFASWATDLTAVFGMASPQDIADSGEQLFDFILRLIADRRAAAGTDLVSALIDTRDADGNRLTDGDVQTLVSTLLMAGFVPPAQSLALGALRLVLDPETATALRAEPELVPTAVDELLRLDPSGAGSADRPMRATCDVEIGGRTIRRGEIVVAPFGAANRDPAQFPDPDRLDLTRGRNPHLTFAPGPHHCLGAALTRMQLDVGLGSLLARLPELTLAVRVPDLEWRTGMGGERNLVALPVTWT